MLIAVTRKNKILDKLLINRPIDFYADVRLETDAYGTVGKLTKGD